MDRTNDQATTTRWAASFHTDRSNGLSVDQPFYEHPLFGSIVSVSTNKTLGTPSGTFTLTFKKPLDFGPRSALRRIWRDPEDVWVQLYAVVDGIPFRVMLGLIDSLQGSDQRSMGGKKTETYTISGRDFGKVFEQASLFANFLHPHSNSIARVSEIQAAGQSRSIGTPAHFIRSAIELWFGNGTENQQTQWMLPPGLGGGSFFGLLSGSGIQNMTEQRHGITIAPHLFAAQQDSVLWDTLSQYSNDVMNEMFVDLAVPLDERQRQGEEGLTPNTRNTKQRPTIFLRERPFPTYDEDSSTTIGAAYNRLKTHTLTTADVKDTRLTKGGAANRYNYWMIQAHGVGSDSYDLAGLSQQLADDGARAGFPGQVPIWSDDSIARHGLRKYTLQTKYLPIPLENEGENSFYELGARWLKRVHDWYITAPFELTGTLPCSRIFPEIRIGERVRYESEEGVIMFYVEGVQHSQAYPGPGSTVLTLTRGTYEDDNLLRFAYHLYTNPRSTTPAEDCFRAGGADFAREDADNEGYLTDQCRFVAVEIAARGAVGTLGGVNDGEVDDSGDFSVVRTNGAVLEAERDGTQPLEGSDSSPMTFELEDAPPEAEAPAAPASPLDAAALEEGTPIRTPEPEADLDSISDDPLGGLEDLL